MELSKAYDVKALADELKKEGIKDGLETLKKGVAILQVWLEKSAALSTEGIVGKLDDIAVKGEKYVTDFIDLPAWPAFNLADLAEAPVAPEAPVAAEEADPAPASPGEAPQS